MEKSIDQLIHEAVTEYKPEMRLETKKILTQAVRQEPRNPRIWYMLSQVVDKKDQATYCLKKVLEIDPLNQKAISRLSILDPKIPSTTTMKHNTEPVSTGNQWKIFWFASIPILFVVVYYAAISFLILLFHFIIFYYLLIH